MGRRRAHRRMSEHVLRRMHRGLLAEGVGAYRRQIGDHAGEEGIAEAAGFIPIHRLTDPGIDDAARPDAEQILAQRLGIEVPRQVAAHLFDAGQLVDALHAAAGRLDERRIENSRRDGGCYRQTSVDQNYFNLMK